jgi:DNA repair exonuclease SbcCD ATPase subunit
VANTLNSATIPILMDDVDALKQKIKALESQIDEERTKHKSELSRVKSENYEALEASQTRYQGELEIQRTNFQRQIEKLKAILRSFDV